MNVDEKTKKNRRLARSQLWSKPATSAGWGGGGMGEGRFCNSISSYFVHDPHGSAGKARPRREDGHHEGDVGSGLVVGHQQQVLTQVPEEGIAGTSTGTRYLIRL